MLNPWSFHTRGEAREDDDNISIMLNAFFGQGHFDVFQRGTFCGCLVRRGWWQATEKYLFATSRKRELLKNIFSRLVAKAWCAEVCGDAWWATEKYLSATSRGRELLKIGVLPADLHGTVFGG